MGAVIPVAGFESVTQAVQVLNEQGHTRPEIAKIIGRDDTYVTAVLHRLKRIDDATPTGQIRYRNADRDTLGTEAGKRGLSARNFERLVVRTVLREGLVNAVLDDDEQG